MIGMKQNYVKPEAEQGKFRNGFPGSLIEDYERRWLKRQSPQCQLCLFCEEIDTGKLYEYTSVHTDKALTRRATEMLDTEILAKISGYDLVAIEVKYHVSCLLQYWNKYQSFLQQQHSPKIWSREQHKARAFTELVAFIEASLEEKSYLFKRSELHQLYQQRLKALEKTLLLNYKTCTIATLL